MWVRTCHYIMQGSLGSVDLCHFWYNKKSHCFDLLFLFAPTHLLSSFTIEVEIESTILLLIHHASIIISYS